MPQRKTTDSVVSDLTQADRDADARKAAILAAIPHPTWQTSIPWIDVYSDRSFNFRDSSADADTYTLQANKGLYLSLKENGLEKRGDPMAFNLDADGRFKVLVGHLRHAMMSKIRDEWLAEREKSGSSFEPSEVPFSTIFGLVYDGLTPGQQTAIMADHIGRKDLNDAEKCREIAEFIYVNGLTMKQGETHFGMDKNKVRRYCMRYAMPTVYAEYVKEKSGNKDVSFVKIGNEQLDSLYAAYLADRESGNGYRVEGPNFRAAWKTVLSNPDALKASANKKGDKSKEKEVLTNLATSTKASFGETPEINAIRLALLFAANQADESGSVPNLNTVQQDVKAYCDGLRADRERLSTALETAVAERDAALTQAALLAKDLEGSTLDYANLSAERIGLQAEIRDRDEHISTMRAEIEKLSTKPTADTNGRRKRS